MLYILITITVIILIILGSIVWTAFNVFYRGFAPFVTTGPKVIMRILEILNPPGDYSGKKIYELGCGKAKFLQEFYKMFPNSDCIGIEYDFWPYIIAKLQAIYHGYKIKIIKKDLFRVKLNDADVIYCFLNKEMMEDLEKKFRFECKNRTTVICHQFPLPTLEAYKVIELLDIKAKKGYENKVYFYQI